MKTNDLHVDQLVKKWMKKTLKKRNSKATKGNFKVVIFWEIKNKSVLQWTGVNHVAIALIFFRLNNSLSIDETCTFRFQNTYAIVFCEVNLICCKV